MRVTVFDGSPRGRESNLTLLMEYFFKGFHLLDGCTSEMVYLNRVKETDKNTAAFLNAEHVIMIFPLYTDAMPGIVKHFIEALEDVSPREENPSLGFIIQSGFPEPVHSRYVARYMEKSAKRLGCRFSGTVIRGGAEGIRVMPPWMTKKLFQLFIDLGRQYAMTGRFDEKIAHKLAPRERLSAGQKLFMNLSRLIGLSNYYWNSMLKKHNAYAKRFAHPYKDF